MASKDSNFNKLSDSSEKPPVRLCHLADIHLGYRRYNKITKSGFNQREVDIAVAFREAIDRLLVLKPQVVLIAGDLYHSVRPSNSVVTRSFKEMRRLAEAGIACVIVAGNHESPKRADSGSLLRLLSEIEGVYIADTKPEKFTFPELGLSVQCLPHAALPELESTKLRADDRYAHNVLVLHAQVGERWVTDFGGVSLNLSQLAPHEWDYIALGHVHTRSAVALNAEYSGSLEHTGSNIWADAERNKGFIEIELPSGKRTFHTLTSPREVIVLDPIDVRGLEPDRVDAKIVESLESVPGGIEGKLVRLEIVNLKREIFRQLDHKLLRQWRAKALNLLLDVKPPPEQDTARALRRSRRSGLKAEFEEFSKRWTSDHVATDGLSELLLGYLGTLEGIDEASKS